MTKLTIKITKDVLRESANCTTKGTKPVENKVGQNCAIGKAICELFPYSWVQPDKIIFSRNDLQFSADGYLDGAGFFSEAELPLEASEFIKQFDKATPEQRLLLPEFSFDIEIPDEVVDTISIDEIKRIVQGSKTLELANSSTIN